MLSLPEADRRKILADNPHLAPEDLGLKPLNNGARQNGKPPAQKAKGRSKTPAKRSRWGNIMTDSRTEVRVAEALASRPDVTTVLLHSCLYLSEAKSVNVDGVAILRVLDDGSFLGKLIDAKGSRGPDKSKPHVERDSATRYEWAKQRYGLAVDCITPEGALTHAFEGGEKIPASLTPEKEEEALRERALNHYGRLIAALLNEAEGDGAAFDEVMEAVEYFR